MFMFNFSSVYDFIESGTLVSSLLYVNYKFVVHLLPLSGLSISYLFLIVSCLVCSGFSSASLPQSVTTHAACSVSCI